MSNDRASRVVGRAALWLSLIPIGLSLGGLAGWLQLQILRYGKLTESQLSVFWATFICTGLVLSLIGGVIGHARLKGRARILVGGIVIPIVAFLVLLPINTRRAPDIYLLVTDATRADHLSLYGYDRDTTPFLEEFATNAVVFRNAVSQGTHTIVSTASLLTSSYPSQHGVKNYSKVLADRFKLLPEYLKEHGYATHAYVTNPHLQPKSGYAQGTDEYEYVKRWSQARAGVANEKLLSWLDSQASNAPTYSFMFYIDSHNPYRPPEPWTSRFDPEWKDTPVSNWKHKWGRPDPKRLRNMVAQYDGGIAYWDDEFRKLVDDLEARGRFDNALIVYTSDHGEEFWEHGFWGHNKEVYEGLVHVPLVVSFPVPLRFPPLPRVSGDVDAVVSSVDVLPTILDYLGITPEPTAVGTTALPQVFGEDDGATRVAYLEEILDQYGPYDIRGVRTRTHKFIRVLSFEGDTSGREMLFDLVEDPGEQHNLVDSDPNTAAELVRLLDELMRRVASGETIEAESTTLDAETIERLKALGYISD